MRRGVVNRKVVLLALVVTFAIYLTAWGGTGEEAAHAGYLNQTIPTITPTGATSTPTSGRPTVPPPTEPPGVPSSTPSPTSLTPSSNPTDEPTSRAATATTPATAELSPTPTPTAGSPTPTLGQTATTALPTAARATDTASPPLNPTATQSLTVEITSLPQPADLELGNTQTPAEPATPSKESGLAGSSCLWIALGLVLILAGVVLLVRWRRTG